MTLIPAGLRPQSLRVGIAFSDSPGKKPSTYGDSFLIGDERSEAKQSIKLLLGSTGVSGYVRNLVRDGFLARLIHEAFGNNDV
jgi:hypothetical protein